MNKRDSLKGIDRRKACLISLYYLAGIVSGNILFEKNPCYLIIPILILIISIYLLNLSKKYIIVYLIGFLIMIVSTNNLLYESSLRMDNSLDNSLDNSSKSIVGIVNEVSPREEGGILTVKTDDKKVIVYSKEDFSSQPSMIGKILSIEGYFEIPSNCSNPGGFDYRKYLFGKGVGRVSYYPKITIIGESNSMFYSLRLWLQTKRNSFVDEVFGDSQEGNLAMGILFGVKNEIPEEEYEAFRKLGIAHILAVSGLHIGIIYGVFNVIRKKTGTRMVSVLLVIILIMYGELALWTPSVVRAILMVIMKIIADILNRKYDMMSSISIVSCIMLTFRPYLIFNQGFILSFLAVYGITIIGPRLRGKMPELITIPMAVQFVVMPYTIMVNNNMALLSIPINIVIVYMVGLYVPLGLGCFIFYLFISVIQVAFTNNFSQGILSIGGYILSKMGGGISGFVYLIEDNLPTGVTIPSPKLWMVFLFVSTLLFLFSEFSIIANERKDLRGRIQVMVLIISMTIGVGALEKSPFDEASQVFLDVGQGDSLHLSWDGNMDILIDGGGRQDYNIGNNVIKPYLLHSGKWNLDMALFTHKHMDHYKGIEELNEIFTIEEIPQGGKEGDTITLSKDRYIKILWPSKDNTNWEEENYYSKVFMIYDHGIKTLITGDITEEGEMALIEKYKGTNELDCHILKVAHHGSRFSSCSQFLKETNPLVAIVSVGRNNYGHPAAETIEKIQGLGIMIYRTDIDGAIGISIDEDGFYVFTMKTAKHHRYVR